MPLVTGCPCANKLTETMHSQDLAIVLQAVLVSPCEESLVQTTVLDLTDFAI